MILFPDPDLTVGLLNAGPSGLCSTRTGLCYTHRHSEQKIVPYEQNYDCIYLNHSGFSVGRLLDSNDTDQLNTAG